jgi:hypothetical protein
MLIRSALFWGIMQRRMVNLYRRFGTIYRSHLRGSRSQMKLHWTSWPLKMRPIYCSETSVKVYHSTLHNTPEERRSQLLRSVITRTLGSRIWIPLKAWTQLRRLCCSVYKTCEDPVYHLRIHQMSKAWLVNSRLAGHMRPAATSLNYVCTIRITQ